jgi:hypothetical protein
MEIVKYDPETAYNAKATKLHGFDVTDSEREEVAEKWAEAPSLKAEDKKIIAAYQSLFDGREVIDLSRTISNDVILQINETVGDRTYHWSVPRLVIGPALAKTIKVEVDRKSYRMKFATKRWNTTIPISRKKGEEIYSCSGEVKVPHIPARILTEEDDLSKLFILFEAEKDDWMLRRAHRERTRPVGDPALLEHISGYAYRVVTTWELTELEKAVLAE